MLLNAGIRLSALSLLLLAVNGPASAQFGLIVPSSSPAQPPLTPAAESGFKAIQKPVVQSRNLLGKAASTIGFGLDSLFGSPDRFQPNESVITSHTGIRFLDTGEAIQLSGLSFQADLPSTATKLQLMVNIDGTNTLQEGGNSPENEQEGGAGTETGRTEDKGSSALFESRVLKANQTGLFIRYIHLPDNHNWQVTLDSGFQFKNNSLTLEPVSYLRIGQTFQVNSWYLRAVPSIYWVRSSGPGTGLAIHTFYAINSSVSLQHSSGINYLFDSQNTYYQHGWQLINVFSPDLRATYSATFYTSDDADDLVDEAQISATLRRRIDGDWLFFSVTPANTLSAKTNYSSDLSITFQLEAKFGIQY